MAYLVSVCSYIKMYGRKFINCSQMPISEWICFGVIFFSLFLKWSCDFYKYHSFDKQQQIKLFSLKKKKKNLYVQDVFCAQDIFCALMFIMEKAMATHSSTFAWKIPWTEEPGRLQSMGSGRVGHDWATSLSVFTFMYRRRKRQPTPVLLPGESQGRGSLVGCRL